MKDDPNIGCGIWPFFLKGSSFQDACRWHDEAYTKGSLIQERMTREETDKWFLMQMKNIAGKSFKKRLLARTFYVLARTFGGPFWEQEEERRGNETDKF